MSYNIGAWFVSQRGPPIVPLSNSVDPGGHIEVIRRRSTINVLPACGVCSLYLGHLSVFFKRRCNVILLDLRVQNKIIVLSTLDVV